VPDGELALERAGLRRDEGDEPLAHRRLPVVRGSVRAQLIEQSLTSGGRHNVLFAQRARIPRCVVG
jgi:hypothetical protein